MNKFFAVLILMVVALVGCQSTPQATEPAVPPSAAVTAPTPTPTPTPAPVLPDPSSIVADATGFSPLAPNPAHALAFSLHFGTPDKVVAWTVKFVGASGEPVRTLEDRAPRLPPTLSWDGKADSGALAPEGSYIARLTVDYGESLAPVSVDSAPFALDITPPSGSITVFPQPFSPGDPDVLVHPPLVTFQVNVVPGGAAVASWRLGVVHPDGRRFFDFISEDHKDNTVTWNGRALNHAQLERGTTYDLVAQVFDRYGNVGLVKATLAVAAAPVPLAEEPAAAAPVTVLLDGKLVAETEVYFPAFSADLGKVGPQKATQNDEALQKLARALAEVKGTQIRVIGHANKVYWQDRARGDREESQVLVPLSLARAEAVRDALVKRGLDPGVFEVTGVGSDDPVVPFGDRVNNWKNRRVEFDVAP